MSCHPVPLLIAFSELKLGFRGDLKFYMPRQIIEVAPLLKEQDRLQQGQDLSM